MFAHFNLGKNIRQPPKQEKHTKTRTLHGKVANQLKNSVGRSQSRGNCQRRTGPKNKRKTEQKTVLQSQDNSEHGFYKIGDLVSARWKDGHWYHAKIIQVLKLDCHPCKYKIRYDMDGIETDFVDSSTVRP